VGTHAATGLLRAALDALARASDLRGERVSEIQRLLRDAPRALGDVVET
jgi:hypothetical protein